MLRSERAPGPLLRSPASSQRDKGTQQPGKVSLVPPPLATTKPCLKQGRFPGGKGRHRAANGAGPMGVCSRHCPPAPGAGIQHLCPKPTPAAAVGPVGQQGPWGSEGRGEKVAASRTACLFFSADWGFAGAGGIHLAERALFFMEEMRQRAFNRK